MKSLVVALLGVTAAGSAAVAADMPLKASARIDAAEQALAPPPPPPSLWTLTTSTEVRYFTWESTRGTPTRITPTTGGGRGSELYIPFAAQVVGRPVDDVKVEVLVRAGWVWAKQNTAGLTGEVATTTDTVVSATFTYLGMQGIQPFLASSFNLPTGRSVLSGSAANARMDPDLVDIASFGEGFNVGPSAGFSIPVTSTLIITASGGYTWRDRYPRENSLAALDPNVQTATNIKPGEVWTGSSSVSNKWGQWAGSISGSVSFEGATFEGATPLYQPGDRYLGTATLSYTWSNGSLTTVNGSYSHSEPNKVLFLGASSLIKEMMNSNSDVWRVGVQHLIPIGQLTIGPTGSYLMRDHNGYDSTTLQFVPAKERYTAGFIARYAANESVIFNARVDRVWTREDPHNAINDLMFSVLAGAFVPGAAIPAISSNGWQAAVGVTSKF